MEIRAGVGLWLSECSDAEACGQRFRERERVSLLFSRSVFKMCCVVFFVDFGLSKWWICSLI